MELQEWLLFASRVAAYLGTEMAFVGGDPAIVLWDCCLDQWEITDDEKLLLNKIRFYFALQLVAIHTKIGTYGYCETCLQVPVHMCTVRSDSKMFVMLHTQENYAICIAMGIENPFMIIDMRESHHLPMHFFDVRYKLVCTSNWSTNGKHTTWCNQQKYEPILHTNLLIPLS